ncbi:phosphoribosyl-AMP cyclohydrolase [bacterium]|nr:phosphoribosyl-AMP cyclohydrolase [bacterium]
MCVLKADHSLIAEINYNKNGLIPAVAQDTQTGEILMLAYMNAASMKMTLDKGLATFWSRSRRELWTKGETSGNTLKVIEILIDCDQDAVVLKVIPAGPACHTLERTCFYRKLAG